MPPSPGLCCGHEELGTVQSSPPLHSHLASPNRHRDVTPPAPPQQPEHPIAVLLDRGTFPRSLGCCDWWKQRQGGGVERVKARGVLVGQRTNLARYWRRFPGRDAIGYSTLTRGRPERAPDARRRLEREDQSEAECVRVRGGVFLLPAVVAPPFCVVGRRRGAWRGRGAARWAGARRVGAFQGPHALLAAWGGRLGGASGPSVGRGARMPSGGRACMGGCID